ncbi:MAG: Ig-like domain-containing protein [Candidatus Alcyoniella australis]|nr:Ig-like domain-containing protein [Candidatus Alcyoniella australis]
MRRLLVCIALLLMLTQLGAGRSDQIQIHPRYTGPQPQRIGRCQQLQVIDWVYLPSRGVKLTALVGTQDQPGSQVKFSVDSEPVATATADSQGVARLIIDPLPPGLHSLQATCECGPQGDSQTDTGVILVRRTQRPLIAILIEGVLLKPRPRASTRDSLTMADVQPEAQARVFEYDRQFDVVLFSTTPGCPALLRKELDELLFPKLPIIKLRSSEPQATREWGGIHLALCVSEEQAAPLLAQGVRVLIVEQPHRRMDWDMIYQRMIQMLKAQGQ